MRPGPGLALRLAWRDGRGSSRRLALSAATVVVGVTALVAIRSFALDVDAAVAAETKSLLGADLQIDADRPFGDEAEALIADIGGDQLREVTLGSMAYFPASGRSRLVRVRAVDPGYPFYGTLDTEPDGAAASLTGGARALVDATLLLQMGAAPGDRMRVGDLELEIAGSIRRLPGEVPTASLVGPRVLIPRALIDRTGLIRPGSRVRYAVQFRLDATPEEVAARVDDLRPDLRRLQLDADTVESRRRWVERALDDLKTFLGLAAITALLLGAVGTASAAAVHARRHREAVAVLRCLGAGPRLPLAAFAVQAVAMAAAGTVAGVVAGLAVQRLLPGVVAPFLPLDVEVAVRPTALLEAGLVGLGVAVAFALGPLLPLRRVRPLVALRADVAPSGADPLVRVLPGLLAAFAAVIAWRQTGSWVLAAGLIAGLGVMLALLAGVASVLRAGARRLVGRGGAWEWRQGVSNLHRPHNQTLVMTLGLGTGVFLVAAMALVGRGLLADLAAIQVAGGADMVLFDVQRDQLAGVLRALGDGGVEVLEEVPVVPMRLGRYQGRPVAEVDDEEVSAWSLRREYNCTYRGAPSDTEEIIEGDWVGRFEQSAGGDRVPVSLSEEIARALHTGVGGELTFDVQGVEVPVRVASIRRVDWQQVRPNFLVVFPTGVLEPAPQQIVVVARAGSDAVSAAAQRAIVESFPNVSVLDMALVLRTVDEVLDRVRLALRFLAGFVVLAGLFVLVAATLEGRSERQREGVLLRTLGASRLQIARIGLAEYLVLGAIAACSGVSLAVVAAWSLLRFVFDTGLQPAPLSLAAIIGATLLITAGLGVWNGRAMARRPAMELIRQA